MPWARGIELALDGHELEAQRIETEQQSMELDVLALMRKMPRSGALNYRGPWASEQIETGGVTQIFGGYVDNFDFPGLPEHVHQVSDGAIVPWVYGDGSEAEYTITITVTFAWEIPDTVFPGTSFGEAYMWFGSALVLDGDTVVSASVGIFDALSARFTVVADQQGHNEVTVTRTATVGGSGTGGLLAGFNFSASNVTLSITRIALTTEGSTAPLNTWRPGRLPIAPTLRTVGDDYAPGDVVSYAEALWMAVTEVDWTDGPPGTSEVWAMLSGSPADAFQGEWS